MRFYIMLLVLLMAFATGSLFTNANAGDWKVKPAPDVILNAAVIIPDNGSIGKSKKAGVSVGILANFLSVEGVGNHTFGELQMLSIGVAMQEAGKFNVEVSPISIKRLSGFTYGVSLAPKLDDARGGYVKLFIGITF